MRKKVLCAVNAPVNALPPYINNSYNLENK